MDFEFVGCPVPETSCRDQCNYQYPDPGFLYRCGLGFRAQIDLKKKYQIVSYLGPYST